MDDDAYSVDYPYDAVDYPYPGEWEDEDAMDFIENLGPLGRDYSKYVSAAASLYAHLQLDNIQPVVGDKLTHVETLKKLRERFGRWTKAGEAYWARLVREVGVQPNQEHQLAVEDEFFGRIVREYFERWGELVRIGIRRLRAEKRARANNPVVLHLEQLPEEPQGDFGKGAVCKRVCVGGGLRSGPGHGNAAPSGGGEVQDGKVVEAKQGDCAGSSLAVLQELGCGDSLLPGSMQREKAKRDVRGQGHAQAAGASELRGDAEVGCGAVGIRGVCEGESPSAPPKLERSRAGGTLREDQEGVVDVASVDGDATCAKASVLYVDVGRGRNWQDYIREELLPGVGGTLHVFGEPPAGGGEGSVDGRVSSSSSSGGVVGRREGGVVERGGTADVGKRNVSERGVEGACSLNCWNYETNEWSCSCNI